MPNMTKDLLNEIEDAKTPTEKAIGKEAMEVLTTPETPRKPYEYTPPPTPKVK